jgi:hypothetical protein
MRNRKAAPEKCMMRKAEKLFPCLAQETQQNPLREWKFYSHSFVTTSAFRAAAAQQQRRGAQLELLQVTY